MQYSQAEAKHRTEIKRRLRYLDVAFSKEESTEQLDRLLRLRMGDEKFAEGINKIVQDVVQANFSTTADKLLALRFIEIVVAQLGNAEDLRLLREAIEDAVIAM